MALPYETNLTLRSIYLNNSSFTDIKGSLIPVDCNTINIVNDSGNPIFYRSDPNNADSQVTIQDGTTYVLGGPRGLPAGVRFTATSTVGALRSTVNGTSISIQCLP